jgi:hypothetical protein
MSPPGPVGAAAPVITIEAPASSDSVGFHIFGAFNPSGYACADDRLELCTTITVDYVPAGHILTIDAARERVTIAGPSTAWEQVDGYQYLIIPPETSIQWISIAGCDPAWIWIETDGWCGVDETFVTIETVIKEGCF